MKNKEPSVVNYLMHTLIPSLGLSEAQLVEFTLSEVERQKAVVRATTGSRSL